MRIIPDFRVPDEDYSRNSSCVLILISMFCISADSGNYNILFAHFRLDSKFIRSYSFPHSVDHCLTIVCPFFDLRLLNSPLVCSKFSYISGLFRFVYFIYILFVTYSKLELVVRSRVWRRKGAIKFWELIHSSSKYNSQYELISMLKWNEIICICKNVNKHRTIIYRIHIDRD